MAFKRMARYWISKDLIRIRILNSLEDLIEGIGNPVQIYSEMNECEVQFSSIWKILGKTVEVFNYHSNDNIIPF